MITIRNPKIFAGCIADALVTIDNNRSLNTGEKIRAINAIAKAVNRIDADGAFMDYDGDADRLVIWSQGSNKVYELSPGKYCGCQAHQNGVICWHKAAKRLIELYNIAMLDLLCSSYVAKKSIETGLPKITIAELFDPAIMPYLKPVDQRPVEICGGVRL